jgi:hypothetical protein
MKRAMITGRGKRKRRRKRPPTNAINDMLPDDVMAIILIEWAYPWQMVEASVCKRWRSIVEAHSGPHSKRGFLIHEREYAEYARHMPGVKVAPLTWTVDANRRSMWEYLGYRFACSNNVRGIEWTSEMLQPLKSCRRLLMHSGSSKIPDTVELVDAIKGPAYSRLNISLWLGLATVRRVANSLEYLQYRCRIPNKSDAFATRDEIHAVGALALTLGHVDFYKDFAGTFVHMPSGSEHFESICKFELPIDKLFYVAGRSGHRTVVKYALERSSWISWIEKYTPIDKFWEGAVETGNIGTLKFLRRHLRYPKILPFTNQEQLWRLACLFYDTCPVKMIEVMKWIIKTWSVDGHGLKMPYLDIALDTGCATAIALCE